MRRVGLEDPSLSHHWDAALRAGLEPLPMALDAELRGLDPARVVYAGARARRTAASRRRDRRPHRRDPTRVDAGRLRERAGLAALTRRAGHPARAPPSKPAVQTAPTDAPSQPAVQTAPTRRHEPSFKARRSNRAHTPPRTLLQSPPFTCAHHPATSRCHNPPRDRLNRPVPACDTLRRVDRHRARRARARLRAALPRPPRGAGRAGRRGARPDRAMAARARQRAAQRSRRRAARVADGRRRPAPRRRRGRGARAARRARAERCGRAHERDGAHGIAVRTGASCPSMTDRWRESMAGWADERGLDFEDAGLLPPWSRTLAAGLGAGEHRAGLVIERTKHSITSVGGFKKRPERSTHHICRGRLPGGLDGLVAHHLHLYLDSDPEGQSWKATPDTVVVCELRGKPMPPDAKVGRVVDLSDGSGPPPQPRSSEERGGYRWKADPAEDPALLRELLGAGLDAAIAAAPAGTTVELRYGALCVS